MDIDYLEDAKKWLQNIAMESPETHQAYALSAIASALIAIAEWSDARPAIPTEDELDLMSFRSHGQVLLKKQLAFQDGRIDELERKLELLEEIVGD